MVNVIWQKNKETYLLIQLNSADLRRHFEGRSLGTGQLFHKTLVSFCPLPAATTKSKQVILTKDERKCKLLLLFCNFDQIWYSLWRCHLGLCHGWHFWRTSLRRTSLLDSCSYKIAVWTETQKKILTTSSQQRHRKSGWCFVFKSPSSVSTRLCTDDFFFFFFLQSINLSHVSSTTTFLLGDSQRFGRAGLVGWLWCTDLYCKLTGVPP